MVAILSSLCSTSYALEESLALMLAVTAARSLITTHSSIEVTSTEPVLLKGASALPLSDTQCMFTETPEEQVCFGNNLPTRIELSPAPPLNIGFLPRATSQIEYHLLPVLITDPVFSDTGVLPELNPASAIATEIQQSAERQRKIIKTTRQRHQTFLLHKSDNKSYEKKLDGLGEEGVEADDQDFEWWKLWESGTGTDDSGMASVRDDDGILLEPGSRYCFFSSENDESQAVTDGESGSEDDTSSGEDSGSEPEDGTDESENGADSNSSVTITHTSTDPMPTYKDNDEKQTRNNILISNFIEQELQEIKRKRFRTSERYSGTTPEEVKDSTFELKKIKTEPTSDNGTPALGEDDQSRPYGKPCNSAQALKDYKRKLQKLKHDDGDPD